MADSTQNFASFKPSGLFTVNTERADVVSSFSDALNMTALDNGNYVVVWDNRDPDHQVLGQVLAADGTPIGDAFDIAVPIPAGGGMDQWSPEVTQTKDGGFFVVWIAEEYNGGYNTGRNVMGRLYDNDGTARAAPFTVAYQVSPNGSVSTSSWETYPTVDTLPDGRFVVAFYDDLQIGVNIVSQDGATITSLGLVAPTDPKDQRAPSVAVLANGGFVVAWQDGEADDSGDNSGSGVRAQIYDAQLEMVGGPFLVNETTYSSQLGAEVEALSGGGFAIAYHDGYDDANGSFRGQATVRVYSDDGTPLGGEILLDPTKEYSTGGEHDIDLTAVPTGGFLAAWRGNVDGFHLRADLFGQEFDEAGDPQGSRYTIVTEPSYQIRPTLATLDNGDVAVSWWSDAVDDRPEGIFGRTYERITPTNDLTGSGPSEILMRRFDDGSAGFWDMESGNAQFTGLGRPGLSYQVQGIGDYTGDGQDEILWRDSNLGSVGYWDLSSGAPQWTGLGRPGSFQIVGSGDFDGNGQDEIMLRQDGTGVTGYWDFSGGGTDWTGIGKPGPTWSIEAIGDFTGDGRDDILWRDSATQTTGFWDISSGAPDWNGLGRPGESFQVRGSGDFNGDGVDDILFRETVSGTAGYWDVSSGNPVFTRLGKSPDSWQIEGVGDYNGNGYDDVLWRDTASRTTGYWDMEGGAPAWTGLGRPGEGWEIVGQGPDDFIF